MHNIFKSKQHASAAGAWVRGVIGDEAAAARAAKLGMAVTKGMSEGINSAGGFLAPDAMADAVLSVREKYGLIRQNAFTPPTSREVVTWPRSLGGIQATWAAEAAALPESTPTFDGVTGVARKLIVYIRSGNELMEDADPALGVWFADEVGRAFAEAEDGAGFVGDGSQAYGGIRDLATLIIDGNHGAGKVAAAGGHNTYLTLDNIDISALVAALPVRALPGAAFYCSQVGFGSTFCRLAGAAGGFTNITINGRNVPAYLGFPVFMTPALPTSSASVTGQTMILFGDMRRSTMLTSRRQLTIAVSTQRYLDQDQVAFRATSRLDIVNHDLGDATTSGAMVGLVAP